jgi:hypothetical protein
MKTIVSTLVLVVLLVLPGASPGYAPDPPPSQTKGKVLLLKNEHTLEGEVERIGERYRVLRSAGETWVPDDEVLGVAGSMTEAYALLRARANLDDADERLRLANWCRLHGLLPQAIAELQVAAQLRPDHAPTRRLLQHLQQTARAPVAPKRPRITDQRATAEPAPAVELTTECLGLFATRVQPILMNTCARCHATGHGGKFRLVQVYEDGPVGRRTLEQNVAAVLAEINLAQPEASRLLTKAVSDHAHTGQAPIKDRKDAPYRTLEKWVKLTIESNPQLRDSTPAPDKSAGTTPPERRAIESGPRTDWGTDAPPPAAGPPAPPGVSPTPVPVSNAKPAPPPPPPAVTPPDPYDPEPFNRQAHPETTSKPGPDK